MEVLENFKYLGQPLDQTDDDWTEVRRYIKQAQRVWEILGKMLWIEGTDTKVAKMFYRAVLQAVLLFDTESWVLSPAMYKTVERVHTGFLCQIKVCVCGGSRARCGWYQQRRNYGKMRGRSWWTLHQLSFSWSFPYQCWYNRTCKPILPCTFPPLYTPSMGSDHYGIEQILSSKTINADDDDVVIVRGYPKTPVSACRKVILLWLNIFTWIPGDKLRRPPICERRPFLFHLFFVQKNGLGGHGWWWSL